MEELVKGNVVVLPFPFSDLTTVKRRPALVAATLEGNDVVLCQITSAPRKDSYTILLQDNDFEEGRLHVESKIRPNRLFTAHKSIMLYSIGTLKRKKISEVQNRIVQIFTS